MIDQLVINQGEGTFGDGRLCEAELEQLAEALEKQ
jgi:hypothetical protein